MAWIESHQELAQHPKTARLARALSSTIPTAIGHLHLFWWWAISYAPTGDITDFDDEEIAVAVMWPGEGGEFLKALDKCRWTDIGDDGRRRIHDWDQYGGKLLKKRLADAERQRLKRLAEALEASNGHPTDVPRTSQVDNTTRHTRQTEQDTTLPTTVVSAGSATAKIIDEKHTRRFAKDSGYTDSEIDEAFHRLTKRSSPPTDLHRYVMGMLANLRSESTAPPVPQSSKFVPSRVKRQ